jgi:hypothetical protein
VTIYSIPSRERSAGRGVQDGTSVATRTPQITLLRLCRACRSQPELVIDPVKTGSSKPRVAATEWRFTLQAQHRAEMATYLWRRCGLNTEGVAFVMGLLDTNRSLREKLQFL